MVHITRQFTAAVEPSAALEYLADFGHTEAWDPGTLTTTRADGEGSIVVGTRWRNVSRFLGRTTELDYELVERTDSLVHFVGRNKAVTSHDRITVIAETAGGSRITYDAQLEFTGWVRLADPLFHLLFSRIGAQVERKMRACLEQL